MSGVTNKLVEEYKRINKDISTPEYDVIVSTGEQYSSALISLMLNEKKISSRSILGWQLPILTDSNYSKARILGIDTRSFKKYLKDYKVLVVAGFQGFQKKIG